VALLSRNSPTQKFEQLKHAAQQARLPFEREAWLNLAFYLDEHYVEWNPEAGAIRKIPREDRLKHVPRPVVNKIMHYVQQEQTMVLRDKPQADVMPATDDYLAIGDADVSKSYVTYIAEPLNANFDKKLSRAALWALIAGEGWLKWVYDDKKGRPDILAPAYFEVYPDPYAKEFSEARYIIHSQFMDTEQVFELWGREVGKASVETADPMRTELLRGMGSAPVLSGVTVNELWMKPCRRYKEGLYVVWTGNTLLVSPTAFPYAHKRLPFTQIGAIERPDSQHYMAPVKYLRSAQMELNKYHAQKIMGREAFANYKWWLPTELQLEKDPDSSPGQILRGISLNGQLKPEILTPPPMPDNGDGAMIEEQMMHIVGLHEVSQAQVPGRVEAAKAIELLKQADADRLSGMEDTIDAAIAEGYYQILMLAKQYVREDQMVAVYGAGNLPEVKRFKAQQIDPGMRIKVTRGTGLGRSHAGRADLLTRLWELGVIRDPDLMAQLLEMPFPSFAAPKALDQREARNENIEMARGTAIVPNSWQDHAVHIREHNDFRKSQEFTTLDDEPRQIFEFHVQNHEMLMQQELMKQLQMQAMMAGAPPQSSQPGSEGGASNRPGDESATSSSQPGSVGA